MSNPTNHPLAPRCPKCGTVMCQQFDYQPVTPLADIATPNGNYVCYGCAPIGSEPPARSELTDECGHWRAQAEEFAEHGLEDYESEPRRANSATT